MRRVALLFAVLTSAQRLSVHAQDTLPPTFRAGTTLIEFTIVVRDSQGNPVTDLTKDDLSITEQGQPRAVEFFRFDGAAPQPSQVALPAGHYTNRFETSPNAARHITAVLIDAMNMPTVKDTYAFTQATVRTQVLNYLDGLPPNTRVGLFRLGRDVIDVLRDFTDDVPSLRAQVAKMELVMPELPAAAGFRDPNFGPAAGGSGSKEMAEGRGAAMAADAKATAAMNAAIQTRRVDLTLPGLEALGNHLARFPGRKNIVWVGNGMPLYLGGSRTNFTTNYEPRMRQTAERLATQGIAIYPVASRLAAESVKDSLNLFADTTGGRVTLTMNDPTEGLKATALDQRAVYSVGFYVVTAPDNTWRPIAVQVRRPNVTVTHRRGYLADAAAPQPLEWGEAEWRTALANPLSSSVVRLDGQIAPAGTAPRTFDFRIQIALDDLHFREVGGKFVADIEIVTAEKISGGELSFRVERATLERLSPNSGALAPYARQWAVRPDTTMIRVIVRDRFTGRYGTLDIPMKP